jgi:predicted porin
MNKKVMAAAVAGVLVAPAAFAQSSNVQLYGRINGGVDYYKATGATDPTLDRDGRFRVFDNSSRVGVRGTEDLGNGLKAIFQIESGVNIDNGPSQTGQGGQANASTGFWGTRDTWGGLQANWGRITFGRQSMYWVNGPNAPFAGAWINTEIPWTNGTNLGRVSGGGIVTARVSNTLQYTSPTWAGNNFTLSWSPNAQETVQGQSSSIIVGTGGTVTTATTAQDADGQIWAATWRGTFGPIYGQIDYANVRGNSPTLPIGGNRVKADLYKAGVSWGYLPGARIGVIWVRTKNNNAPGYQGTDVSKNGYTVNWFQTFGNIQAMAQYGWTGDVDGCQVGTTQVCDQTSSKGFMVGARYLLSKRTWLYLTYNQVTNKSNEFVDYTGAAQTSTNSQATLTTSVTATGAGAVASVSGTPYGADPRILALGFFHHF